MSFEPSLLFNLIIPFSASKTVLVLSNKSPSSSSSFALRSSVSAANASLISLSTPSRRAISSLISVTAFTKSCASLSILRCNSSSAAARVSASVCNAVLMLLTLVTNALLRVSKAFAVSLPKLPNVVSSYASFSVALCTSAVI